MNKLSIVVLVAALAASCLGLPLDEDKLAAIDHSTDLSDEEVSEWAMIPEQDQEVARMQGENKIFADFCLQSRDEVVAFLRGSVNGAAAKVFNVMFNTITDVSEDVASVQKEAVQEGVELIRQNAIKVEPSESFSEEGEEEGPQSKGQIVTEVEGNIRRGNSLLAVVSGAVRIVIKSVVDTVASETSKRLALLKASFTGENVRERIQEACDSISFDLNRSLDRKLSETKREISKSSKAAEYAEVLSRARLDNVGCVTSGRVAKVAKFCNILKSLGSVIYPMMNLS